MTDESYNFNAARARLEEIVTQVRKKDTSLEKSLDLLEEGVRLANACTELIDHQDWAVTTQPAEEATAEPGAAPDTEVVAETTEPDDDAAEIESEPDGPSSAEG